MSQASSAQREPSMEEILASIRRIIEESDTAAAKKPAEDPVAAVPVEQDIEGGVMDIDAFRSELSDQADTVEADIKKEAAGPASTLSLSDVQSSLRREPPETGSGSASVEDPIAAAFEGEKLVSPQPIDLEDAGAQARSDDGDETLKFDSMGFTRATSAAEKLAAGDAAPATEPHQSDQYARPALISEHPGRQVAAAFGELSDAFAASRRKSFDEMAEEMLRPMLQDWLDNNLPTLVERLVREEIERVARGASG